MKSVVLAVILSLFLLGCSRTWTLAMVRDQYGPPGKIEYTDSTTTYFYYFYKGVLQGGLVGNKNIAIGGGEYTSNWKIMEVIADKTGKVIKIRDYWKQPEAPRNDGFCLLD